MNPDDFSGDIAARRRILEEVDRQFAEDVKGVPQTGEPKGIFQDQPVPARPGKKIIVKPGDTFTFGGIQYKVAGDRSFHRITEGKPSRKAWRRQQVLARKAERERKRRVKGW